MSLAVQSNLLTGGEGWAAKRKFCIKMMVCRRPLKIVAVCHACIEDCSVPLGAKKLGVTSSEVHWCSLFSWVLPGFAAAARGDPSSADTTFAMRFTGFAGMDAIAISLDCFLAALNKLGPGEGLQRGDAVRFVGLMCGP